MRIRRSTFRRILIAGLVVAVAAAISVTIAVASNVTIETPPIATKELEIDGTIVGTFPVYNGGSNTTVTYPAYLFAPGVNGSYRLSIWQNSTPLAASPTWTEIHINHHWASDPNPTMFTFGPFLASEKMCETCPSIVVVQPETYNVIVDENDFTSYAYFPIVGAFTSGPLALTQSDEVLFNGIAAQGDKCKGGGGCMDFCMQEVFQFCIDNTSNEEDFDDCMDDGFDFCRTDFCAEAPAVCGACGDGFCSLDEFLNQSCSADCI